MFKKTGPAGMPVHLKPKIKTNKMKFLTTTIRIELEASLNEIATIEQDDNGFWGFQTTKGYNSWEGTPFKTFDKAFTVLKKYEAESIKDLKYQ